MRFYTIEMNGEYLPAASNDGGKTAYVLADLGVQVGDMAEFVRKHGENAVELLAGAFEKTDTAKAIDVKSAKLMAPIMYPDQDMVCLGVNYGEHAVEASRFSNEDFGHDRPYTIYFSKRVSRATGTGEAIPAYVDLVDGLDYEAELGVILGKEAKGVSKADASSYIFGYTVVNDVSARNLQTRHKQWYLGKSLDGFTPMGPCIVTPDELGDAKNLAIGSTVNGETRQNSNTKYMLQTVEGAIADLCAGMTLKAGTIIATGTPAGVGMGFVPPKYMKPGDVVTCYIEGIGELVNPVE